jgi:hypothetical protein
MYWPPAESLAAEPTRDGAKYKTKKNINHKKKEKRGESLHLFLKI